MQETKEKCDALIREFVENYMGKLFYFCLKKTGDQTRAEDLTQDIALVILTALRKGTVPENFPAWVWQIARNRYAAWAKEKRRQNEAVTGSDIGDYEIPDDGGGVLDEMIRAEQLALLRRELAFIKSDYRRIVVAYYIKGKNVREIAQQCSLSQNTVKSRLLRARERLKEGMEMAREFGIRSYRPEEITFADNSLSFGDNEQPWSIICHKLYKNIFLAAYGNPSTAEELSIELGVALPYMEDELEYLTRQTFLIRQKNKYQTSFPIIGKEMRERIREYNSRIVEELTALFEKLLDDYTAACEAHGIRYYGRYISYEDAKWVLLMRAFDVLASANPGGTSAYAKRPDNGSWNIVGYQNADIPDIPSVALHRSCGKFFQYRFAYKNIEAKTPPFLCAEEVHTMEKIVAGEWETCGQIWLDRLAAYGYLRKAGETYAPAIALLDFTAAQKNWECFTAEEQQSISATTEEIRPILSRAREFTSALTAESLPPLFRDNEKLCRYAGNSSMISRDMILMQAIEDGWIRYNENTGKAVGTYMNV